MRPVHGDGGYLPPCWDHNTKIRSGQGIIPADIICPITRGLGGSHYIDSTQTAETAKDPEIVTQKVKSVQTTE